VRVDDGAVRRPVPGAGAPATPPRLLERDSYLESLEAWWADVASGHGRLVLVAGEAGVGKTALVRAFCDRGPPLARVLWGGCDGLRTPRPLAPFVDIAAITGGAFAETVARGESVTALVVATYRDDELAADHPVRSVLALALADADPEKPLRQAYDELQTLGARPAAAIVARKLRERGARGVPRGPRPRTRENPAGLTTREREVLGLLTEGCVTRTSQSDRSSQRKPSIITSRRSCASSTSALAAKRPRRRDDSG
jgi:hypothetical protein